MSDVRKESAAKVPSSMSSPAAVAPVVRRIDLRNEPFRPTAKKAGKAPAVNPQISNLAMYAAIVGKVPDIDPTASDPFEAMDEDHRDRQRWSAVVMSIYLRDIYRQGALMLNKPEITAWMRRQSGIARKRLAESQARLSSTPKKDRAA